MGTIPTCLGYCQDQKHLEEEGQAHHPHRPQLYLSATAERPQKEVAAARTSTGCREATVLPGLSPQLRQSLTSISSKVGLMALLTTCSLTHGPLCV